MSKRDFFLTSVTIHHVPIVKGWEGVMTYNLCPYFQCPIQGRGGGGKRRMGKCPLLGNFFLEGLKIHFFILDCMKELQHLQLKLKLLK